jgi:hypothetical protein
MDIQAKTGSFSRTGLFLVVLLAQGSYARTAYHSAAHGNPRIGSPAQIGRANLTVEDLKTLLGQSARDPSSQAWAQEQDVTAPANPLKITLDSSSARRLARVLAELEIKRIEFERKVMQESEAEIEKLRDARKKIQNSRMSSSEAKDGKLSRELFDSFLSEANSKARIEKALREFDQEHMVSIDFVENADSKSVEKIFIGGEMAWSAAEQRSRYARK